MNTFRFKYTKTVWVLIALILLITAGGLAFNIYNIISFFDNDTFKTVVYFIITALNALLFAFAVSVVFFSKYVVKGDMLFCYFGVIKTKNKIADIVQITHFKKSEKLVVYFQDAKFSVVVIAKEYYEAFTKAIREINNNVIADVNHQDEKTA